MEVSERSTWVTPPGPVQCWPHQYSSTGLLELLSEQWRSTAREEAPHPETRWRGAREGQGAGPRGREGSEIWYLPDIGQAVVGGEGCLDTRSRLFTTEAEK